MPFLFSKPAFPLEDRWMVCVAQTQDTQVDINLDTAITLGGPVAPQPLNFRRVILLSPLPPRFQSHRDVPCSITTTK